MIKTKLVAVVGALLVLAVLVSFTEASQPTVSAPVLHYHGVQAHQSPLPSMISRTVLNENGPVAGAIVQIQGKPEQIQTAKNGTFTINGITGTTPVVVSAWTAGHYVGWAIVDPGAPDYTGGGGINITLKPLPETDNSQYTGFTAEGVEGSASCGLC